VAMSACALAAFLLYRRITGITRFSKLLWVGVMGTLLWVIVAGLTHFNAARAFSFPPGAFKLSHSFFLGLGSAMLIATYDYWGYYNVCFIGAEIKDPGRNIPRAVLISIAVVAALYLAMNISVLGVVPWQEMVTAAKSDTRFYIISVFMERLYGHWAGYLATALIMWTAFASVFSLLLGYSRVPYAAALEGNYFKAFARLHPEHRFPSVSLLALATVAAMFCLLRLADVIAALVVIRLMIQFLVQAIGLVLLRARHPEARRPFRMWLYPLPALAATAGFVYIMIARPNFMREIRYATMILVFGVIIYVGRSWHRREWPFGAAAKAD
jgi:APA family basic amino acid/polyamine antiporter